MAEYTVNNRTYTILNDTDVSLKKYITGSNGNDISHVKIYDSVTISGKPYNITEISTDAFKYNVKITNIIIGKNVKIIKNDSFGDCAYLNTVKIVNNSLLTEINERAFSNCTKLTLFELPTGTGNNITIANNAFLNCTSLRIINLPTRVISVNEFAFSGCSNMTFLTLLKSTTFWGATASTIDAESDLYKYYMIVDKNITNNLNVTSYLSLNNNQSISLENNFNFGSNIQTKKLSVKENGSIHYTTTDLISATQLYGQSQELIEFSSTTVVYTMSYLQSNSSVSIYFKTNETDVLVTIYLSNHNSSPNEIEITIFNCTCSYSFNTSQSSAYAISVSNISDYITKLGPYDHTTYYTPNTVEKLDKLKFRYTSRKQVPPYCFNQGTKIECFNDKLQPVEHLKIGDLVKTYKHGYRRIKHIMVSRFHNNPDVFGKCMYTMKQTMNDDLTITGWHSIMVDDLGEYEYANTKRFGFTSVIDDKYLLLCSISNDFIKLTNTNVYIVYNFALDGGDCDTARYGVYANGVLCETPSYEMIKDK